MAMYVALFVVWLGISLSCDQLVCKRIADFVGFLPHHYFALFTWLTDSILPQTYSDDAVFFSANLFQLITDFILGGMVGRWYGSRLKP